jgi:hypothetical protein
MTHPVSLGVILDAAVTNMEYDGDQNESLVTIPNP